MRGQAATSSPRSALGGGFSPGQAIAILIDASAGNSTATAISPAHQFGDDRGLGHLKRYDDQRFSPRSPSQDHSGTLSTINNSGTIAAVTSTLDNGLQTHIAVNLQANTSGVNFQNSGTVIGDIFFGSGDDTLNVSSAGTIYGDQSFNPAISPSMAAMIR